MTRLSPLTSADLDDDQRQVWESLTATRGRGLELVGSDGSLVGPFNAFVHAPKVGKRLSSLGALLRFRTSIDRRLSEVAICTVGAYWHSEFEFWAHVPMAIEHGVPEAVLAAMRGGRTPEFERDDERVVYDVTTQLLESHRVDPETFVAGKDVLGEKGMVELASTIGYYCLISMTLNLFEVGLPDGEEQNWPDR